MSRLEESRNSRRLHQQISAEDECDQEKEAYFEMKREQIKDIYQNDVIIEETD